MLKLDIWNSSANYTIDDVVRDITIDENLASNLESSSSIWKVTIPRNNPYILDIIQKDDLHARLYDGATVFYTGWVSTSFNYTIDSHGQQAVQITLEDNGTHLLKTPYTKDVSKVISGKFSWDSTSDPGVVQQICNACGIECLTNLTIPAMIQDSTHVEAVADAAESCESLLKSVCKEMKCVYLFDGNGKLYLKPLSLPSLPSLTPLDDSDLYDSIKLVRKARTYRGSRIKWKELASRNGALIYRVIEGQDTIHPDCYVPITYGQTLPSPDGGYTYYDATDIKNGSEVFSISNVVPTIQCPPADGSVDYTTDPLDSNPNKFIQYGAKSLKMLIKVTSSGHINKMQATADIRYVSSENVTYGDANDPNESITENLHEEECRWLHNDAADEQDPTILGPVTRFANFVAQYDRYCSSEFSFTTKGVNTFALGDIIRLNENLHTGLDAYLMITRRSRTLTSYDPSNKTFSGVWTYRAVATKAFDYNKTATKESTATSPSTTYTEAMPSVVESSSLTISPAQSTVDRDLRAGVSDTQSLGVRVFVTGGTVSNIHVAASLSDETPLTVTTVTTDTEWTVTVPKNTQASAVIITATAGTIIESASVSFVDKTVYNLFHGIQDDATDITATKLTGDFYYNKTDGITYVWDGNGWSELALTSADSAEKLLTALNSALQANPPISLDVMSNKNTVSWFNTIIASKAVIDNLFSKTITILNNGSISSHNFSEVNGFVSQGFKISSSGLGQFGEGTQLGNVDIRITDQVGQTPVQLLTTSKYAAGDSFSVLPKSRWSADEVLSNSTHWNYCQSPYTDNPTVSYNGTNYYPLKSDFMFKPGESSDYVLVFDKACTVTLNFNGSVSGIGRWGSYDFLIDGQRYHWIIDPNSSSSATRLTYTKTVSAGGSIRVNTSSYPYKPQNTGNENDGVRLLGSVTLSVSGARAVLCDKRVKGYSNTSTQTLPTAGTYNFVVIPTGTYIANALSFTHTYQGGGTVYSSSYINYTNLSNFASLAVGNYTCTNSNINGNAVTSLTRSGNEIYFGDTTGYSVVPDTSAFASSGWYNLTGSINLVASQSSLITYNINASGADADIGAVTPYRNIYAGNYYGNVNSQTTAPSYRVWGAVWNP